MRSKTDAMEHHAKANGDAMECILAKFAPTSTSSPDVMPGTFPSLTKIYTGVKLKFCNGLIASHLLITLISMRMLCPIMVQIDLSGVIFY